MSQRILVVDDEPAIADAVADRLRSDGYEVAVVHDGLAAVAYCGATPPDRSLWSVNRSRWDAARLRHQLGCAPGS